MWTFLTRGLARRVLGRPAAVGHRGRGVEDRRVDGVGQHPHPRSGRERAQVAGEVLADRRDEVGALQRGPGEQPLVAGHQAALEAGVVLGDDDRGVRAAAERIAVFDAETDEDILRAGQAIKAAGKLRALAGCAGFAEALPELIDFTRRETAFEKARGPALLACGSLHPASVAQTEYAIECCGYAQIALDARLLLGAEELDATAARAAGRLSKAENVALRARGGRAAIDEARRLKPSIPEIGMDGIPLRDELELERTLAQGGRLNRS